MTTYWIVSLAFAGVYWRFWKICGPEPSTNRDHTGLRNGSDGRIRKYKAKDRQLLLAWTTELPISCPTAMPQVTCPSSSGSYKASGRGLWGRHFYSLLFPSKSSRRCLSYYATRTYNAVSTANGKEVLFTWQIVVCDSIVFHVGLSSCFFNLNGCQLCRTLRTAG